jgi:hypothetical protein
MLRCGSVPRFDSFAPTPERDCFVAVLLLRNSPVGCHVYACVDMLHPMRNACLRERKHGTQALSYDNQFVPDTSREAAQRLALT